MDRLDAMSVLLAAVEAGSLSKAGRMLGLPLTTVSRKVSELESHLNASLLVRSAKGLELTAAGRSYVAAARSILEQVTEAERAASGEYVAAKGDLLVTAPTMFGRMHLLPAVTDFLTAYPDVAAGLVFTDRFAHLLDDNIDVALRIGALPDSSLTAVRLGSVRRVVCASPAYLAAHGTPSTPADLVEHAAISFEGASSPRVWSFESGGAVSAAPIRSRLSVNTVEAAIDAALSGAGIARAMSYQIVEFVRRRQLSVLLEAFAEAPSPVHLVYHGSGRLPLKVRAFIDFVGPRVRDRLRSAAL